MLMASNAQAGTATLFACKMSRECINAEPCAGTDVDLNVEQSKGNAAPFQLYTPAETVNGVFSDDNDPAGATFFVARSTGAYHLLSVDAGRNAVWSVQMPISNIVLTYFGTCEE